jgi:hypothetical protein
MKKVIFAIILLISLFAITGLALADNALSGDPLGEIWTAINSLRGQVADLKADQEVKTAPAGIVTDDFEKTAREAVAKNKSMPQSEHYALRSVTF